MGETGNDRDWECPIPGLCEGSTLLASPVVEDVMLFFRNL
jgi:hypothetical protein